MAVMQTSGRACSHDRATLAFILGFSLLSKLGLALLVWFHNRTAIWHPDSASYHNLALNMLRRGIFSRSGGPPFVYEAFRTPGYPLLLASLYPFSGNSVLRVIVLQAAMATGTVALTWLLGRRLFSSRVGTWAAVLLSLDVASVCSSQMLMSETLFTLLVLASVWLVVRSLQPLRGWTGFALTGLALACAVHVRPIGYYLVPLGAVAILGTGRGRGRGRGGIQDSESRVQSPEGESRGKYDEFRWRRALTRAGAFLLAPVVLVGGWQVKNLQRTGSARFSHLEGLNMYFYRAGGVLSVRDHKPLFEVHRDMGLETERTDFTGWVAKNPEFAGRNHAVLGEQWLHDGISIIVRNPGWFALMQLRSTAALLLDPGTFCFATLAGVESDQRGQELLAHLQVAPASFLGMVWTSHRFLFLSSVWGLALLAVVYAGVVIWLVRARKRDWTPGVVAVVAVLAYFILISAGPEAASRFRVPIAPLFALLSAAGWHGRYK